MDRSIRALGWTELGGVRLTNNDLSEMLCRDPMMITRLGGEFFLEWDGCRARDHFGIMPGDCPPGAVVCGGKVIGKIDPNSQAGGLAEAIEIAVRLRSDEGVVAMSGGVDSALVARLAGRECVVVGIEGSHDLMHARQVADLLDFSLQRVMIDPGSIEDRLRQVLLVIPKIDPVNASIATTLNYVAEWAALRGHRRILAGQGADELFGGYSRYLQTETLALDLEKDFLGLSMQLARDQAVAGLHGTYFSLPYMDVRVVAAALSIPAGEKVCDGVRKRPLRDVAERFMPSIVAQYGKKAMQYGSGVMKEIQRLANQKGYRKSVQDYLLYLCNEEGRDIGLKIA